MRVWFSFEISHRGEIRKVYHPADEDDEVLIMKKGFAGMLSAKSFIIMLHFHEDLNTIHSVMIEEEMNIDFSTKAGYDPFHAMRPVHAVSGFSNMGFPTVTASSKDKLEFFKKRDFTVQFEKPIGIESSSIHHTKKIKKRAIYQTQTEVKLAKTYIAGNLTCIRHQPERGSPQLGKCFHMLTRTLDQMTESDVEQIANTYFLTVTPKNKDDKNTMAEALIALNKQDVIVNKILNNLQTDEQLLMRVLTSLTALDHEPFMELLTTVEKFCFKGKRSERILLSKNIRHVSCLTFGGLVGSVKQYGNSEHADKLVQYLHDELGLHDPWLFKMKRSAMSEIECVEYDHNKVVLLDAIGNAGLPVSYDHIVSHINSTNSQWIKRTGVHALRTFHDIKTLQELEKVALYDDDETVRYEALLQYEAHPLANADTTGDGTGLAHTGVAKRSILDLKLAFRLAAPGVDWRKMIGSESVGASFGIVMENLLDLQMSLIKGSIDVRVHDEAYVRVHLGYIGISLDFYLARICFKGSAKYALNILKELDPKHGSDLIKQFTSIVDKVVGAIKNGVEAFKRIISTDFSLKDIVDDFVKAVTEIPEK
ncbi:uncharacterized protein LOC132734490, partial [Ruditapes philippinarum]|uniref:uncharacterized protein LOC132734490 n=1 Tax=Ruditapes philippinarum TaxID=129788 RepID=UPI00295AB09A